MERNFFTGIFAYPSQRTVSATLHAGLPLKACKRLTSYSVDSIARPSEPPKSLDKLPFFDVSLGE